MKKLRKSFVVMVVFGAFLLGLAPLNVTNASHSWANYHWARSTNPVALAVGDNISPVWDGHLDVAVSDWNISPVINLTKTVGLTNPKNCKPVAGRIEVCNAKYGKNGWLGLAQIRVSGDHITSAVAKLNDTYFNTSPYNTPVWRQFVMCQEIAHDFGLDHQDENFSNPNLGSCMDYTNNPSGPLSNEHPNTHDYDELLLIYEHLDALIAALTQTSGKNQEEAGVDFSDPKEWGKEIRYDSSGRPNLFENDLGKGKKIITHVIWVDSVEGK
ncbi:MAG: hypothetical protein WC873_03850 [Candidatus Gracilibacteria bacterium]